MSAVPTITRSALPDSVIRLTTIGPFAVHVGEVRVPATNQQVISALFFLAIERGRPVHRRVLAEMFFPEASEEDKGHSVRQLIYRLRQLGAAVMTIESGVQLPANSVTWDVGELLMRQLVLDSELEALAKGYLTDFTPSHSARFAQWLDDHRAQVTARLRHVLVRQIGTERSRGKYRALEYVARACLALDPLNEEATLAIAESLAIAGAKAEALHVLDRYLDEIGTRSVDLRLAPRLLRERISEYIVDPEQKPVELIGRDPELSTLLSILAQAASGSARACIVIGPSGIGKTRLLNEACSRAALTGQAVVRARLHRHDSKRPFAVLRELGPGLLDLPGALGASAAALAALRGLCGRGPSQYRTIPSGSFEVAAVVAEVHTRVVEVVDAVADEQPLILLIEDAHWIDEASLSLLTEILDGHRGVCVLLASQRDISLPGFVGLSPAVASIPLRPLDHEESRTLLRGLADQARISPDSRFVESATLAAGGVPFFLHLLFHNFRATGDPHALPSTLSASLAERLGRLREPARGVFEAIVLLGPYSTEARLQRTMQHPAYKLQHALRLLEDDGFIRVIDNTISPAHDLLALATRERMSASVSRFLHRVIATCLTDDPAPIEPLAIAAHWEACGDHDRALAVLTFSAKEYARLGRPREGVALLERARDLGGSENQREVSEQLLALYGAAGEDRKGYNLAQTLGLYSGQGDETLQTFALGFLVGAGETLVPHANHLRRLAGNRDIGLRLRASAARQLLILAEDLASPQMGREALELISDLDATASQVLSTQLIYETTFGSRDLAVSLAARVYEASRAASTVSERVAALSTAGIAAWRTGDGPQAITYIEEAYALSKGSKVWSACTAQSAMLASLFWNVGDTPAARRWFDISSQHIRQAPGYDGGLYHLGIGILLALEDADVALATALVDEAERLFPRVHDHRMGLDRVAYRVRIELACGNQPGREELETLLQGHLERRDKGLHDLIADTVVAALLKAGRLEEADRLRDDYLNVHRKDAYPLSPHLRALQRGVRR